MRSMMKMEKTMMWLRLMNGWIEWSKQSRRECSGITGLYSARVEKGRWNELCDEIRSKRLKFFRKSADLKKAGNSSSSLTSRHFSLWVLLYLKVTEHWRLDLVHCKFALLSIMSDFISLTSCMDRRQMPTHDFIITLPTSHDRELSLPRCMNGWLQNCLKSGTNQQPQQVQKMSQYMIEWTCSPLWSLCRFYSFSGPSLYIHSVTNENYKLDALLHFLYGCMGHFRRLFEKTDLVHDAWMDRLQHEEKVGGESYEKRI